MTHNWTVMKRKQRVDIHKNQTKGGSCWENFLLSPKHTSGPSPKAGAPLCIAWIPTPAWQAALMPCAQVHRRKWSFWFACGYWRCAQTNIIRIEAKVMNWIEWGLVDCLQVQRKPHLRPSSCYLILWRDKCRIFISSCFIPWNDLNLEFFSSKIKIHSCFATCLLQEWNNVTTPLDRPKLRFGLSFHHHSHEFKKHSDYLSWFTAYMQLQLYSRQLELDQLIKYIETLTGGSQLGFLKSLFSHLGSVLACLKTVSSNH